MPTCLRGAGFFETQCTVVGLVATFSETHNQFYRQMDRLTQWYYLDCSLGAFCLEVVIFHHLGHDETSLKVRVNLAGCLWCLCPSLHSQRQSHHSNKGTIPQHVHQIHCYESHLCNCGRVVHLRRVRCLSLSNCLTALPLQISLRIRRHVSACLNGMVYNMAANFLQNSNLLHPSI